MSDVAGDGRYLLAFEEARRSIDKQADELEQVRARIGTLFSVAAVVAALPASAVVDRADQVDPFGVASLVLAGVALSFVAASVVAIWWPAETTFKLDAGTIVGSYIEGDPPMTLAEVQRELALYGGRHLQANRPRVDSKMRWFSLATVAFLVEVGAVLGIALDLV